MLSIQGAQPKASVLASQNKREGRVGREGESQSEEVALGLRVTSQVHTEAGGTTLQGYVTGQSSLEL